MAYTPTYTEADMAPIAIDGIASILALVVAFASLIGLIMLYRWVRGKKVMQ